MTLDPPSGLTLYDEVDLRDQGPVVGLEGADVGTLVIYPHLLNVDGEVTVVVVGHSHAIVQRPLVCPRVEDVGAVQPRPVSHFFLDPASFTWTGGGLLFLTFCPITVQHFILFRL